MSLPTLRLADPKFPEGTLEALAAVLASGNLTQGPVVAQFEEAVCELTGAKHGIATTSATTAIELALAALDIGPGDEVVAADFTYPATGNAVLQRGAMLKLADVDPETYGVDPGAVIAALTPNTKAVLAVDVFGLPADYTTIEPLLRERGVALICDAACGLGGAIGTQKVGTFGLASCFSFHPRKSLTTGEGGMVVTSDDAYAARLRRLRNHGTERTGWRMSFIEPGFNYRMSDLNAVLGLQQVPGFPAVVRRRGELAAGLRARLEAIDGVTPQQIPEGHTHPYQAFVVTCDESVDRDAAVLALRERGVESTLGTYSMHSEPAFQKACGTKPGDRPASLALAQRTLALPLHEGLDEDDLDRIARELRAVLTAD
jgi:perosamine synthetase